MFSKTVLICIGLQIAFVLTFGPRAGPYIVKINQIEKCEDQGSGKILYDTRISKVGREYIFRSNITLNIALDENYSNEVELQKWGNGGYKRNAQHTLKNCKELFMFFGNFMKNIKDSSGNSLQKCDVPTGNYTIEWKLNLDMGKWVPVLEYGKYRVFERMRSKGTLVACMVFYGEALPKPRLI